MWFIIPERAFLKRGTAGGETMFDWVHGSQYTDESDDDDEMTPNAHNAVPPGCLVKVGLFTVGGKTSPGLRRFNT